MTFHWLKCKWIKVNKMWIRQICIFIWRQGLRPPLQLAIKLCFLWSRLQLDGIWPLILTPGINMGLGCPHEDLWSLSDHTPPLNKQCSRLQCLILYSSEWHLNKNNNNATQLHGCFSQAVIFNNHCTGPVHIGHGHDVLWRQLELSQTTVKSCFFFLDSCLSFKADERAALCSC